jgi:ribosomal protein S12 methylthiotransferase accessory factor
MEGQRTETGGTLPKVPGTQRILSAEETFKRVLPIAKSVGVTRLADITGLDRVGIPTWSAVVPDSNDVFSVYSGKGMRPIDAKVGALMEAIERQTALRTRLPIVEGTFLELSREHEIVDPADLKEVLSPDYSETKTYAWVMGRELCSGTEVLVPAKFAGYLWSDVPHPPCHSYSSTNGISAGSIREEAICQALCELIERDAWTLAEIGAHVLPRVRHRIARRASLASACDDLDFIPWLEVRDDPAVEMLERAGLSPVLHDITSDIGIPTVFAAIADETIPGHSMVHCGLGTHPDAQVALRRAVTEAAQSRCVDIQAVREDIEQPEAPSGAANAHVRRVRQVNRRLWHLGRSGEAHRLADLPSVSYPDVMDDLKHILSALRSRVIERCIAVDFTPAGAPVSVVRVIVPDLETWSLAKGPTGRRVFDYWKRHA